jgi:hypothetical protein
MGLALRRRGRPRGGLVRRYQYWGRPAYGHFYYFSTPLKQWYKFKGLIHWPNMPRPVERRILRALDVFLFYTGYWGRYRRRKLNYLRQLRRDRQS